MRCAPLGQGATPQLDNVSDHTVKQGQLGGTLCTNLGSLRFVKMSQMCLVLCKHTTVNYSPRGVWQVDDVHCMVPLQELGPNTQGACVCVCSSVQRVPHTYSHKHSL